MTDRTKFPLSLSLWLLGLFQLKCFGWRSSLKIYLILKKNLKNAKIRKISGKKIFKAFPKKAFKVKFWCVTLITNSSFNISLWNWWHIKSFACCIKNSNCFWIQRGISELFIQPYWFSWKFYNICMWFNEVARK